MIKVVNKYRVPAGSFTYIGRGSALGNPFAMKRESQRNEVVAKYREHFHVQVKIAGSPIREATKELYLRAKKGQDIQLGCFCAPKACHGDIIKEFIELMLEGESK